MTGTRKIKFLPVDVAGYMATEKDGKPADRYAALWVEKSGDDDARMYVGMTADEEMRFRTSCKEAKLIPRTQHAMIGSDGRTRYCGVWGRPPASRHHGSDVIETSSRETSSRTRQTGATSCLIDVAVSGASKPQSTRERAQAALRECGEEAQDQARRSRRPAGSGHGELPAGRESEGTRRSSARDREGPGSLSAKQYRVIALARLGKKQDALTELAKFQKEDAPESSKLYLAAVVAAELGEGTEKAFEALEAAIKKQPKDADLRYDAARAFSLASRAVSRSDKAKGRQLAERCLQLLEEAVKNDDADFGKMDEDADLDPIRDDPAFAEIMKAGHPDRRYAAVWTAMRASRRSRSTGLIPPPTCEVPGTDRPGLSPGVVVGDPDHSRRTAGGRLGLAPPRPGGGQGPTCRAAGTGGGRPGSHGQGRGGLVPPAAQCRSPAPQLHPQLAEPLGADPRRSPPNSTAIDSPPADAHAPRGSRKWTPSCSTPRPRCGGR